MEKVEIKSENAQNLSKIKQDPEIQPRRSCRIVMRKSLDDLKMAPKESENETEEEKNESSDENYEETPRKNPSTIRRFRTKFSKNNEPAKKRKKSEELPTDYEELKQKTAAGEIPSTVFYRASSNSMYIPTITADMLQDNGTSLTVTTATNDYFKYVRVRQKTKSDHADPNKVFEIIDAVRRRPIIWDQRLLCHQNVCLIRRAWQQLDAELGLDEEYPLVRRKQIWKNKKDYFSFAANTNNLQKWMFSSAMEFYRPMIKFRATVCLRPTVPASSGDVAAKKTTNLFDKLVLANKSVSCTPDDKNNVMTYLLKSLHETGMASAEMMQSHMQKILEIFHRNLEKIGEKYDIKQEK